MDVTTPPNDRPQPVFTGWGVPWPSDDVLQADADTAWATEMGLVDVEFFDALDALDASNAFDGEWGDGRSLPSGGPDPAGVPASGSDLGPGWGFESTGTLDRDCAALLAELEDRVRDRHRATAAEYRLIGLLLHDAAADPVPWVGPDPTLDLKWNDSRGRTVAAVRRDRRDMAERAVIAEIATRLRLSEQTVRTRAAHAETLQSRCPEVWNAFSAGRISERHAIESARLATSLPAAHEAPPGSPSIDPQSPDSISVPGETSVDAREGHLDGVDLVASSAAQPSDISPSVTSPSAEDGRSSWRAFDEGALDRALRLPPARFTVAARALRERVHSESVDARHRRAARDRGVWVSPELDGMATLTALLPADRAYDALTRVDRIARHFAGAPGEERTLAQLRADAAADLLTHVTETGSTDSQDGVIPDPGTRPRPTARPGRRASIVITVPALTLLGAGSEPATLDGYGPIDHDTARCLAGEATSWVRVLTHPLTGVPLALDRATYRVPTALRRWLGVTSPTCAFPGCGRPARECDLDHLTAWIDGGGTDDDNLAPECRHHHRLRHESRWQPSRDPDTGAARWTSPLGADVAEDPPPF